MTTKPEKEITVGVFVHRKPKGFGINAYVRDYNASWGGCNLVTVNAINGTDAKRKAIAIIKDHLSTDELQQTIKIRDE